ncbi:hypothetical protein WJS89_05660 [Sphingomicrobium sp. XHP0235]|uniref:hypothetical protein n=1 Tax=Sphingomicrobium aquimarinum TaxID=3133971 RepID=UPI0031FE59BA
MSKAVEFDALVAWAAELAEIEFELESFRGELLQILEMPGQERRDALARAVDKLDGLEASILSASRLLDEQTFDKMFSIRS